MNLTLMEQSSPLGYDKETNMEGRISNPLLVSVSECRRMIDNHHSHTHKNTSTQLNPVGKPQSHSPTQLNPAGKPQSYSPTQLNPFGQQTVKQNNIIQSGNCLREDDRVSPSQTCKSSTADADVYEQSSAIESTVTHINSFGGKYSTSQWIGMASKSSSSSSSSHEVSSIHKLSSHKDASTSTDEPIPAQPSFNHGLEMPKVSPTHETSPTHRALPGVAMDSHPARSINANMAMDGGGREAGDTVVAGRRMRRQMQDGGVNGRKMRDVIMEQEINRLSRKKREIVMRDRVIEPESWKRTVQKQMEEELERRVRDALETPPLERMRRNRQQAKADKTTKQPISLSLKECDSYAHTLPTLRNHSNQSWEPSEMPYDPSDPRNPRNRLTRLAGPSGGDHRGDGSDSDDGNVGSTNTNQNSSHHRGRYDGTMSTDEEESDLNSDRARMMAKARRKAFHQYTAEGFKAALRKGQGGLRKIGSGKYVDKNGVIMTMDGPFWPPECGPLYPKPEHHTREPKEKELLAEDVPQDGRTVTNQRTKWYRPFEATYLNVYDSQRTSKGFIPHTVPDGCSPSLVFESRFESGNLRLVRRIGQFEYDLYLKTDLYTARHTQWFYFRVNKMVQGVTYKFNIVNLLKKNSLYSHGMRPLVYSEREVEMNNHGWHRTGHHISYTKRCQPQRNALLNAEMTYYCLEWQMEFLHENDTCYLAHCYPYTFTDLREDIDTLLSDPARRRCTRRDVMCESRAGNSCFLLTVTNFTDTTGKQVSSKPHIVVTARVHPGETNSSWMMKGLLEYITGPDPAASDLRDAFVFKVVPMLNPDGVIVGNYRCSLAGRDLNRNFRHPRRESFPTVWHAKTMLEDLSRRGQVSVYCDMHGHSRRHNVFIYGCDKNGGEIDAASFLYQRLFPWLMSRQAPDKFSFHGCKFHVKRCKEATGRVVMWRELGISNSFTMEATFCGSKDMATAEVSRHFNSVDFQDLGRHFCGALQVYHKAQENKSLYSELILELTRAITHQILGSRDLLPQRTPSDILANSETRNADSQPRQMSSLPEDNSKLAESKPPSSGHDRSRQLAYSLEGRLETMRMIDALSSETVQGCIDILRDLHAMKTLAESDSSDSDSGSESEAAPSKEKERSLQQKKKKKMGKNRSRSMPSLPGAVVTGVIRKHCRKDGKNHLRLALKSQPHEVAATMPYAAAVPLRSLQIYALSTDVDAVGFDIRPFRGLSHRRQQQQGGPEDEVRYRVLEPKRLDETETVGELRSSQGSLPNIGSVSCDDDNNLTPETNLQMVKKYPPFVNRYIGRSNSGLPMFAQERLEERAIRRMEALQKLEQAHLRKQTSSIQFAEGSNRSSCETYPQVRNDEMGFPLDSPAHMLQSSLASSPVRKPFPVNLRQAYTHRNSAMIRGHHPLHGSEVVDTDRPQDVVPKDRPCTTASGHPTHRKLQPMLSNNAPSSTAENQPYSISQVHGAFVDQLINSFGLVNPQNTNPIINHQHDVPPNQSSGDGGRLTNGEAGGVQADRTLPINGHNPAIRLFSGLPGHRGDNARNYEVSNPWLGARNLGNDNGQSVRESTTSLNRATLPSRAQGSRHLATLKKEHTELIEQQYGRFLSAVDNKRAPSNTAKYLQGVVKSVQGVAPASSTIQRGRSTREDTK